MSLAELLNNSSFLELTSNNKIRYKYSNHEMPPDINVVKAYLNGKKFLKAKEWYCYDYSKYEPFIIAHHSNSKKLYCKITNSAINKIPSDVEKHVNGQKYLRLVIHANYSSLLCN